MLEHGSWMGVFLAGVTRDKDVDLPVVTRWIGRFVLPLIPAAIVFGTTFYISVQGAIGHIADNKEAITQANLRIDQVQSRQDKTLDDMSKRIDTIQTMLAIEISKKR